MATLPDDVLAGALARLGAANARTRERFPGDPTRRQPVHTFYLPVQRFARDAPAEIGAAARQALAKHGPAFAAAIGSAPDLADDLAARVAAKLEREPVEDLRIDFEDGYGVHSDDDEDAMARAAAAELAAMPAIPLVGIRVKTLAGDTAARALRTLDLFVTTLVAKLGGLPAGFAVTLSKITDAEHLRVAADVLDALEPRLGLAPGALRLDIMVETTQCIEFLPALTDAARGRLRTACLGTYDFTGAYGVAAPHQGLRHPACDFAKHRMRIAFAETGVSLADGSTHILPVGADIGAAWRLHADDVRHSLVNGFYQGWDLHPAQLATRFGAVYRFFREGLRALDADIARDAGTNQARAGFVARGLACGAFSADEVHR